MCVCVCVCVCMYIYGIIIVRYIYKVSNEILFSHKRE